MVTCQKNLGSVGIKLLFFFLLSAKPEIVVPGSGIRFRYFIFEISGKPSFVEAVLWRVLCSQCRQKASGWINITLLLIKQYINISRYTNIDKFVNIRYIFLLACRAYSWLFQLAQMWKLLAQGVGLGDFLIPALPTELGQKTARCESLRALFPYVEWNRFVTLAGSKSRLRVTLSYLVNKY